MRDFMNSWIVAALVMAFASGCPQQGDELKDGGASADAGPMERDGGTAPEDAGRDAGMRPAPNRPPADPLDEPDEPDEPPAPPPKTEVPAELVGAWQSSPIDFALWENYREGYYAGRNAVPSREAMVLYENGDAKFYRYEFALTVYEELIDCEGTVAFHGDGTFTFYPVQGRKRFYDTSSSQNNVDRALTAKELLDPELAGTRAFTYDPSKPSALLIAVPSSAPYYWYKKE